MKDNRKKEDDEVSRIMLYILLITIICSLGNVYRIYNSESKIMEQIMDKSIYTLQLIDDKIPVQFEIQQKWI